MSKGYIVIAQNSKVDYLRQAYALALSLKATQTTVNNLTVLTNDTVPDKYKEVFDVQSIPWTDSAEQSDWKINNKWKYYYATPYDETVILDTDMIFTADVSQWWETLQLKDIWAATNVRTYRNELVTNDTYRKVFTSNKLPNIYTAFFYFKQSELGVELYNLLNSIFDNWERYFYLYLDEDRPAFLSADVAYALAIKILGIEEDCTWNSLKEFPTFVHMKSKIQNIPLKDITEEWEQHIPTYYTSNGELLVGNFVQTLPFHYHRKEWLTDNIISNLERRVGI